LILSDQSYGLPHKIPDSPERMHGTLKAETCKPPAATAEEQQARFDRFREEFNAVRPHEALGQRTPEEFYKPSARPYPSRIDDPVYGPDDQVRRVRFEGNQLVLMPPPRPWQGVTQHRELLWEKVG